MPDKLSILRKALTRDDITVIYHEQRNGFIPQDESVEHRRVSSNPDGQEALRFIDKLLLYVAHNSGCYANDFDYLDKTPCTCGLRDLFNPKGIN